MNFQFYVEKLRDSENFKDFIKENKDAFACSGFFIIDKQGKDNKQHIDYYIPSKKNMISFQLEDNCSIMPLEMTNPSVPEEMFLDFNFDFNDVERLIQDEMTQRRVKKQIQKILFSLQTKNKKNYLIGTIFISGFGLLKVNINLSEIKIIDFEKKSFFDMIKITRKKEDKNG